MGAAIERRTADVIPAGHTVRPLRDFILLKSLEWDPSEILEVIRYGRPLRGIVKAIGPGAYEKRYSRDRSRVWDTDIYRKTECQVGQTVELGGLNIFDGEGYSFPTILYEGEVHLMVREADVAILCD
jgi:hypothetical protein